MINRRKIFAIILFIFMSLFIFTFANPGGTFEIGESPVINVEPELVKIIEGTEYDVLTGVTVVDDRDELIATADITDTTDLEIGEHEITYTAIDTDNNVGTATRTIKVLDPDADEDGDNYTNIEEYENDSDFDDPDSTPTDLRPVVTVIPALVKLMPGTDYPLLTGVSAADDFDLVTVSANFVTTVTMPIGNNLVTYTSTADRTGRTGEGTRTIRILDPNADEDLDGYTNGEEDDADTDWDDIDEYPDYPKEPTITLDEDNIYQIEVFSLIPVFEATATDVADGSVPVVITHNILNNIVGTYTVTFKATDSLGNVATLTREFKVVDTTKPIISLIGSNELIRVGDTYIDKGALAIDLYDGISNVVGVSTVNPLVKGIYTVTYNHTDLNGNIADTVIRNVYVVSVEELENAISEGNEILDFVGDKEVSTKLQDLLDELEDAINDGEDIIDDLTSTQEEIDDQTDIINEIIDRIKALTFTVTFMADGNLVKAETVLFGLDATAPLAPTKVGYTFSEWSGEYTDVIDDVIINAIYSVNTHSVTYILDGTAISYTLVTYGTALTPYAVTPKDGYSFSGWSPSVPATMPDGDLVFTGSITANTYNAYFYVNSVLIGTVPTVYGSAIIAPSFVEEDGYTFSGWGTLGNMPAHDEHFYATYTANLDTEYVVEHYKENLDGTYSIVTTDTNYLTGITDTLATAIPNIYSGYYYNSAISTSSGNIAGDGSLVLKLYYSLESYTLTYYVDGSEYFSEELKFGEEINLIPEPELLGYSFDGWSLTPSTMPALDYDVEGKFVANTYNAHFYVNDEPYMMVPTVYDKPIIAPSFVEEDGYTFSGWGTLGNMPAYDDYLYATYTADIDTSYKVVYKYENLDHTFSEVEVLLSGTTDTLVNAPIIDVIGFNYNASMSTVSGNVAGDGSLVLYVYYLRNIHTVTYTLEGDFYDEFDYMYGETLSLIPDPIAIEGYEFDGWVGLPTTMPDSNVTVTGNYSIQTYNAYFYVNGAYYETVPTVYGEPIIAPEYTVLDGHTFSGWGTLGNMPSHDLTFDATDTIDVYLSSISATLDPYTYLVGQPMGTLTVYANYSDGTSTVITSYSVSGFDTSTVSDLKYLTVSYTEDGITKTYDVAYRVYDDYSAGYIVLTDQGTSIKAEYFSHDNIKNFKYYVTDTRLYGDFNTIISTILTNGTDVPDLKKIPGYSGTNKYGIVEPLISGKYYYFAGVNASDKSTDYQYIYID